MYEYNNVYYYVSLKSHSHYVSFKDFSFVRNKSSIISQGKGHALFVSIFFAQAKFISKIEFNHSTEALHEVIFWMLQVYNSRPCLILKSHILCLHRRWLQHRGWNHVKVVTNAVILLILCRPHRWHQAPVAKDTLRNIMKIQKKDTRFRTANSSARTSFQQSAKHTAQINTDIYKLMCKTTVQVVSIG